ncbi:hypothetical protein CHUAL_012770 [Chamberlinius hualienensis]
MPQIGSSGDFNESPEEEAVPNNKCTVNTFKQIQQQGSIRKVLPSVPDVDTQLSMAAKMIDRRTTISPRASHNFGPFFLEYALVAEYGLLQKQNLTGIYVIPAAKILRQWFGVMFIRQGPYQGGIFKFTVNIPENYPDGDCPGIVFDTPVFHPQVNHESGDLDVKKGFQKWRRNVNRIWHLLLYARRIFYMVEVGDPLNEEAAKLYENDPEAFQKRAAESTKISIDRLYDPPRIDDPHAIRFSPYDAQIHGEVNTKTFGKVVKLGSANGVGSRPGLSWIKNGSTEVFSKDKSPS